MCARRQSLRLLAVAVASAAFSPMLHAATITWIGGNVDWVDATGTANWNPADEPDPNDDVIFNTANSVNLGSANAIQSLAMSGGIDLDLYTYNLTVSGGAITLNDASTRLIIPTGSTLTANGIYGYTSSDIILDGGAINYDYAGTSSYSYLYVSAASVGGQGTITNNDVLSSVTTVFYNNGTLSAYAPWLGGPFPLVPLSGTLTIAAASANARIDLDGTLNNAVVSVGRNQTLNINLALTDSFDGSMLFYRNSRLNLPSGWTMSSGTMTVSNGYGGSIYTLPGTAYIQGGTFIQSGGTITLDTYDSTLQFDAPFSMTGGSLVNNGLVIFNASTTIDTGANFTMPGSASSFTVNPGVSVVVNQANFNADGSGLSTNIITVEPGGILQLNIGTGGDNALTGSTILNGAYLYLYNSAGDWSIDGNVSTGASTGLSYIYGDTLTVYGTLAVAAGSTLTLSAATVFYGGSYIGDGLLRVQSTSTTSYSTTISVATFDFDGTAAGSLHTIADGVTFTINSTNFDTDGDMDDPLVLGGNGATFAINGPAQWIMLNNFTTNSAAAGYAYINGTSRFVLQSTMTVLGNTSIGAPVTFGAGSTTNIVSGATLTLGGANTIFGGGTVSGAGAFYPAGNVTVSANSTISCTSFNFDGAAWTVNQGVTFTVNVTDYDPDNSSSKGFGYYLTLNGGTIVCNTAQPSFVIDSGYLTMDSPSGAYSVWSGQALQFGDDSSAPSLSVTGSGYAQFAPVVTFLAGPTVNVASGAHLVFLNAVNLYPVNGAINASFTGSGLLLFSGPVLVAEATTFNMPGGTVDLDGADATGDTISIFAPLTVYAATFSDFGAINMSGTNTLTIDRLNAGHTGSLSVILDSSASSWYLNAPGVMNLLNTTSVATLLAGNAANLYGTVNVTGDVRSTAPIHLGGTLNIAASSLFRFNGGNTSTNPNTLVGGIINGTGSLVIASGCALRGYGTINAPVSSLFAGELSADNGTLIINGSIVSIGTLGTADADGILNIPSAWSTNVATNVTLLGGTLTGGTIYNNNANGITGKGIVSAYVINNGRFHANTPGTLTFTNPGTDYDGSLLTEVGILMASNGGTLEIRDRSYFGPFNGTINANAATIYLNNAYADIATGSQFILANGGLFKAYAPTANAMSISNLMTIGAGADSEIQFSPGQTLTLASTLVASLSGNLRLNTSNTIIQAGAAFSGTGSLINVGSLFPDATASIGVLLDNRGILGPAGSAQGRIDVRDFQQSSAGTLQIQLAGTSLNQFDRLVSSGVGVLAGNMEVSLVSFAPSIGNSFIVLSAAGGVSGTFASINCPSTTSLSVSPVINLGYLFTPTYNATFVQLTNTADFYEIQSGTYPNNFTGSNWELHKTTANNATLTGTSTYTGPTVVQAGVLYFNPATNATSAVSISPSATASLVGSGNALIVPVTITGSSGAWTSRLDVNKSAFIVATSGGAAKSAKLAELANQIGFGRSGGSWLGYGISSLYAVNNPSVVTVGLFDNADLSFSTYNGRSVNANSLIVTAAVIGDANLDHNVDLADYDVWYKHVGGSASATSRGDFNLDSNIDLADYDAWYKHVGAALPLLTTFSPAPATSSTVPEPASLALLTLATLPLLKRHRR